MIEHRLVRENVQHSSFEYDKEEVNYFYDPSSNIGRFASKGSSPEANASFDYNFRNREVRWVAGKRLGEEALSSFINYTGTVFDTSNIEVGYPELVELTNGLDERSGISYSRLEVNKYYLCRSIMAGEFEYRDRMYVPTQKEGIVAHSYTLFRFGEIMEGHEIDGIEFTGILASQHWKDEESIGAITWDDYSHEPRISHVKDAPGEFEDVIVAIHKGIPEEKRNYYSKFADTSHLFFDMSQQEVDTITNLVAPIWTKA